MKSFNEFFNDLLNEDATLKASHNSDINDKVNRNDKGRMLKLSINNKAMGKSKMTPLQKQKALSKKHGIVKTDMKALNKSVMSGRDAKGKKLED